MNRAHPRALRGGFHLAAGAFIFAGVVSLSGAAPAAPAPGSAAPTSAPAAPASAGAGAPVEPAAKGTPPLEAVVSADNQIASELGAQILARGGDTADAAVTVALALGVLHPVGSGLGGGGFAVVWRAGERRAYALDFREVAPRAASRDMYLDQEGQPIPDASRVGARAAAVPGELAGLWALHQRHGRLPWAEVVAPAERIAREGAPLSEHMHRAIVSKKALLRESPALARLYLDRSGEPLPVGTLIRRPALARTLTEIKRRGVNAFYRGRIARTLVREIRRGGGIITRADLAEYRVKERPVLRGSYRGHELLTMPPPSSGGIVLLQVLSVLEGSFEDAMLRSGNELSIHRLVEALKHAFADRARVLGDPDFTPVPVDQLLSRDRIRTIRALFNPSGVLPQSRYGGRYRIPEDGGTSHFNLIDQRGNGIALTTTVNTSFGSRFVAGSTGILLNNEMDDFIIRPGVPNAFGLIGQASNAIQPGKRPLSSMSPTIVLKRGGIELMVGASGGPTIITGTLQVLLKLLDPSREGVEALSSPRIHHQWYPEQLMTDAALPAGLRRALLSRGHRLRRWRRFTSVQAIRRRVGGYEGLVDFTKNGAPSGVDRQGNLWRSP